jgi:phage tail protein X
MVRFPLRKLLVGIVTVVGIAGCTAASTPAPMATLQPTAPPAQAPSATPTASPTVTPAEIAVITPAHTATPVTPSVTPTITNTPGPFQHEVQQGDQLIAVVQTYGHYDLGVLDAIVALNPNVPNRDSVPPPGSIILVPRPTASPTPPGGELTATVIAQNPPAPTARLLTATHVVEENQTIIGIATVYNTTMAILAELNPGLYWRGCNFSIASGGPDCSPPLSIGEEIVVPLPSPTPSLTPTPSGSETPTPTPTISPVRLLWPAPDAIVTGGPLMLEWVSIGVLQPDELYQVTVLDSTTSVIYTEFTCNNTLTLPGHLQPVDAATHQMTWQVFVVRVGSDNVAFRIGALGEERPFQWMAGQ